MALSLCPSCARHVRANVASPCPFCGALVSPSIGKEPAPRVSRAARILGVAAIGVACGGTTAPTDGGTDGSNDDVSAQPAYGAVIPDSGFDAPTPPDAATDASDAGNDVDSSGVALYGAPPPLDAGND